MAQPGAVGAGGSSGRRWRAARSSCATATYDLDHGLPGSRDAAWTWVLVSAVIDFAVGDTRPDLTLLLRVTPEVSWQRLAARQSGAPRRSADRMEEADAGFFERVSRGYNAIAAAEPGRIRVIDATASVEDAVSAVAIWKETSSFSG